jgi:membrane protease YdiL (CAAX protease family)
MQMRNTPLVRSVVFVTLTILVALPFYAGVLLAGNLGAGFGLYLTGWLWSPALASVITRKIYEEPVSADAWRLGRPRYAVLAYFLAPGYLLLAYLPIWVFGFGHFPNWVFVGRVTTSLGWHGVSPAVVIPCFVILQSGIGFVREAIAGLGEEIGWRGFLVPELAKTMSFTGVSMFTGLATALWAYPIVVANTGTIGSPLWYRLVCFTVIVVSVNFAFTWLRLRSGGIWPCVILHGSHNVFVDRVFTPFTADTGRTAYFVDEFGVGLAVSLSVVAYVFWTQKHRLDLRGDMIIGPPNAGQGAAA